MYSLVLCRNHPCRSAGRFRTNEILAPLARGGMGEVYVAFDTTLQRKIALKAVRGDRLDDEARARLLREARILSRRDDVRSHGRIDE